MRRRKRTDVSMPFLEHVKDLRKVLIITAYAVAAGTILGWVLADPAFAYLAKPVMELDKGMFITTTPMEPVMVKLKVSLIIGVAFALPVIMWQIWSFLLPALKQKERKYLYIVVPSSVLLFVGGVAFSFYLVLPMGIKFLLLAGGNSVPSTAFVTKSSYLGFLLTFIVTFGLMFQLPVVLLILIRIGLLSPKTLAKKRRWALFGIIVLVAVVSPTPELFTQVLMVVPMYMLYEISIWLGYLVARSREKALAGS
ncbi:twin-arginine translocase subunit TatC [Paradesulfitobacterium aromaticivorans]